MQCSACLKHLEFFSAGLTTKIRVNNRKVGGDGIKEGGGKGRC